MPARVDVENNEYIILSNFGGRFMSKLLMWFQKPPRVFSKKKKASLKIAFIQIHWISST